jgi:hypothetical protein
MTAGLQDYYAITPLNLYAAKPFEQHQSDDRRQLFHFLPFHNSIWLSDHLILRRLKFCQGINFAEIKIFLHLQKKDVNCQVKLFQPDRSFIPLASVIFYL